MIIRFRVLALTFAALVTELVCAQTKDRPQFEVASVKVSKERKQPRLAYNPMGIDLSGVPLTWLIGEAYGVPYSRISAQDSSAHELLMSRDDFYDVAAKADHEVSRDQVRLMVRTLLADRFKLAVHPEARVESVYNLGVAKSGSKLKASASGGEPFSRSESELRTPVFRTGPSWPWSSGLLHLCLATSKVNWVSSFRHAKL